MSVSGRSGWPAQLTSLRQFRGTSRGLARSLLKAGVDKAVCSSKYPDPKRHTQLQPSPQSFASAESLVRCTEEVYHETLVMPAQAAPQDIRASLSVPREKAVRRATQVVTTESPVEQPAYTLPGKDIVMVDSLAKLEEMHRHIFEENPHFATCHPRSAQHNRLDQHAEVLESSHPADGSRNSSAPIRNLDGGAICTATDAEKQQHEAQSRDNAARDHDDGSESVDTASRPGLYSFRVVGLDAEWEPFDPLSAVTLLQIATRRKAFLVDMLWFCRRPPVGWASPGGVLPQATPREAALSTFLGDLFAADDIVKAGFQLQGDLRHLCRSFPQLPCFRPSAVAEQECRATEVVSYVDVKTVALALFPHHPGVSKSVGLAKLVSALLGRTLNKRQQVSSWGVRPLTAEQIAYAAADAHVLTSLVDRLVSEVAPPKVQLGAFPEELTSRLDLVEAAEEARLWSKVHAASTPAEQMPALHRPMLPASTAPAQQSLPLGQPLVHGRQRRLERTPRLASTTKEHSVNLAALEEYLGLRFPKGGRSVVMQVASADKDGSIPRAIPRYPRGGGIVVWGSNETIMLFVNVDPDAMASAYPNTFPGNGRNLTFFPAPGQSDRNPVVRRMLGLPPTEHTPSRRIQIAERPAASDHVLLFCRLRQRKWDHYMYCGRLVNPRVDWHAGSNGIFMWELQDYERLAGKEYFQTLVKTANAKAKQEVWIAQRAL